MDTGKHRKHYTLRDHAIMFALPFVLFVVIAILWVAIGGQSGLRAIKSFQSNYGGGLDRTVTVYSYDGKPIKSWSGKFDVTESESETYFDLDGKRVIIQGGIVINEEN